MGMSGMFNCGRVDAGLAPGVGDGGSVFAGNGGSCARSNPNGASKAIATIAQRNFLRFIDG
jgi:hypothetical protein